MEYWCHLWSRFRFTPSYFLYHISLASPSTRRMREQKSNRQKQSNRKSSISRQRTQPKPSACPGSCPLAEVYPVGWHFKPPITLTPTASAVHISHMQQTCFLCIHISITPWLWSAVRHWDQLDCPLAVGYVLISHSNQPKCCNQLIFVLPPGRLTVGIAFLFYCVQISHEFN